ncbi:putative cytochrome P450 [Colletotrichum karsti]|uniref:Cytochrome P450 n=1 Tax=Colletotrichum karsti TaxID=1095194 RepID=A0A9P6LGT8_9PEZI|nr:putative cytochrome P450 [Colletotrichum karsti]KAF9871787.1 putative cytochrome P450 [Colletotrichum karsti]
MSVPTVSPRPDAPFDFQSLMLQGYFEHPNKPFKIVGPTSDLILLPKQYASELGTYSSQQLSFGSAIHDFWMSKYTTWRYHLDDETGRQTLMGSLRRDGPHIVSAVDEEIERGFQEWEDRYFQPTKEKIFVNSDASHDGWTDISMNPCLRPLVNQAFGRVLVDAPLCRDVDWLNAASGTGIKLMLAARDLRGLPAWSRPVLKHFLPNYRNLMATRRTIAERTVPLVKARLLQDSGLEEKPHDMIGYQLQHSKGWRATDVDFHVGQIFDNVFAGDNQIVNALLQCAYDLAALPEYQQPLRDEVRSVLGQGNDITLEALSRMPKIDSFMKEVVRLRPGTLIVMARKALCDVQLSDGLVIPRGVTVAMPSCAINHDPAIYGEDASDFKPFRFVSSDDSTPPAAAFESISGPGLDFGRGKAPCPGRYISLWTMKVVLARFVLRYEVKLKPGLDRPRDIAAGVHRIADLKGSMLIRKVVA